MAMDLYLHLLALDLMDMELHPDLGLEMDLLQGATGFSPFTDASLATYTFATDDGYANDDSKDGRNACSDAFIQAIGSGTTWSLESFVFTFAARSKRQGGNFGTGATE
ncbi:hypothetical protein SUGI_1157740 [Cryptomeria japonica]|nr:hypothetical protein SUGI_1157740 [Cryptomeria japonica]